MFIRQKLTELAFKCLIQKKEKGKIGSIIRYKDHLQMADHLYPNIFLDLDDQRLLFQTRSETNQLPANKGDPGPCPLDCGSLLLNNPHILQCSLIDTGEKYTYGWKFSLREINTFCVTFCQFSSWPRVKMSHRRAQKKVLSWQVHYEE